MEGNSTDVSITMNDFYNKLSERVSDYNAKLVLQSAAVSTGIDREQSRLNREEARAICLELIKRGGPAFQVGKAMYQSVQ
ncbi:MAG: hypothetical protein HRT45_05340 [Bdellovibrionales bacterium]|nr:hypothetical protein [Bdellovibrionales bacterium]